MNDGMYDAMNHEDAEIDRGASLDSSTRACADWGAFLPDAAEDLLSEAENRALQLHLAGCAACAIQLAEERRGAAWLTLLRVGTPEPPADVVDGMLARILAQTSGLQTSGVQTSVAPDPAGVPMRELFPAWLPGLPPAATERGGWRGRIARWFGVEDGLLPLRAPRLAMTASMAFLSVCLTANLLGVSGSHLHAEDLRATQLQQTVQGKGTGLLRSVEGTWVMSQLESQMELKLNGWLLAGNTHDDTQLRQ